MENNLIKNTTNVFYTVRPSENTVVSGSDFYSGMVRDVRLSRKFGDAVRYDVEETASKIAKFTDGKLIKHTRTEIITEITEEVKLEEEK